MLVFQFIYFVFETLFGLFFIIMLFFKLPLEIFILFSDFIQSFCIDLVAIFFNFKLLRNKKFLYFSWVHYVLVIEINIKNMRAGRSMPGLKTAVNRRTGQKREVPKHKENKRTLR